MSQVTLTFDNGPTVDTTPFVLEHLRARELTAFFCLVGSQLQQGNEQLDIARETLAQGHRVVNHSLTHGVALGDEPTLEHAVREVNDMHKLMDRSLGDWGERWYRPFGRGGKIGKHILSEPAVKELKTLEYSMLLWNSVPRDWEDVEGWVETALLDIEQSEHTVIVLHDLNTGAMNALPCFLDTVLERGNLFTEALPPDCVPISKGKCVWSNDKFSEIVATEP